MSNKIISLVEQHINEYGSINQESYNSICESVLNGAKALVDEIEKDVKKLDKADDKTEETSIQKDIRKNASDFSDMESDIADKDKKKYDELRDTLSKLLGKADEAKDKI